MAFITTGLTNGGQTTNYQIQYDDQLDAAVGKAVGNALVAGCETDFTLMTGWWGGLASPFTSGRMTVNIQAGNTSGGGTGASWNTRSGPITLIPGLAAHSATASVSQWFVRYLLVSEVVEMFMEAQGLGWSGSTWHSGGTEGSAGEGLSRFLGTQFLLLNGQSAPPSGYDIAFTWLTTTARDDFVNHVDPVENGFVPSVGCGVLFVYYLFAQLGFTIPQICAAGADQLATVYQNLTGDHSDPFPYFKQLLDVAFPGTTTTTTGNRDNPWPLGTLSFYGAKNTFAKDEVTDLVDHAGGTRPLDFWLALDGFNSATLGANRPSAPAIAFPGVTAPASSPDIQLQSTNPLVPQRILFPYDIHFTTDTENGFPSSGETPALATTSITVLGKQLTATDDFFFTSGEDPYFTNVQFNPDPAKQNAPWLSQDLRVFTATPALNQFPVTGAPQFGADSIPAAYSYIQAVIDHLNSAFNDPAGVDPFDVGSSVLPGQVGAYTGDSSVTPRTWIGPVSFTNYNFAVCRVRLNGASGAIASNVKAFFRMWGTQTADTDFDPNGTYLSHVDSGGFPQWPLAPSDNHTIPFFATSNAPDFTDANNPEYGTGGVNNATITIDHAGGEWHYFGCFLNVYDPSFVVNGVRVQDALPGDHHCLVAEIAYSGAQIKNQNGVTTSPENSDKLAQRNLQVTISGNPGLGATRRIPQTFDLRRSAPLSGDPADVPDELMIDWGSVPAGSTAQIYWPGADAQDIVDTATHLYGVHDVSVVDPHTVQLTTTPGVGYLPIPAGTGDGLAGLLTIDLPPTVVKGQEYDVVVRRLSTRTLEVAPPPPVITIASAPATKRAAATGRATAAVKEPATDALVSPPQSEESHGTVSHRRPEPTRAQLAAAEQEPPVQGAIKERYVVGTFQVKIPVRTERVMLPDELDRLAIFKARLAALPAADRWHPVLVRYVALLGERVKALGGDPAEVPPSYEGFPHGHGCPKRHCPEGHEHGRCDCDCGCHGERGERGERGARGRRGKAGKPGAPGADGAPGTDGADGKDGPRGKDGKRGKKGKRGKAGRRGKRGRPGRPAGCHCGGC